MINQQDILNITGNEFISDEQAFVALMRENQERVYRLAFHFLGDPEEAKDATQETFIRAWRKIGILRRETCRAWLSKTTVNLCLDWLRKRKFSGDISEDSQHQLLDPDSGPLEECLDNEIQAKVREALLSLAPKYRNVLVLRDLEGMSYQEIAEMLDMKISKVKSDIFRGRQELKEILRPFFEVSK